MIKNKHVAGEVSALMLEFAGKIDVSISLVEATCSEAAFKEYRRGAGAVMGCIYTDTLYALYQENPELKPEGLE